MSLAWEKESPYAEKLPKRMGYNKDQKDPGFNLSLVIE
jgi:hypothetical protein